MGGWVKVFADGTFEMGTDIDVRDGKASWRDGRLDGMTGVSVKSGDQHIAIKGIGKFWQSDDYECAIGSSEPTILTRRIMYQLELGDRMFGELATEHSTMLRVYNVYDSPSEAATTEKLHVLPLDSHGKWLVLEYYIPTKVVRWSISNVRI